MSIAALAGCQTMAGPSTLCDVLAQIGDGGAIEFDPTLVDDPILENHLNDLNAAATAVCR